MKKLVIAFQIFFVSVNLSAQSSWTKIFKEQKIIENITYTFPPEVGEQDRDAYVRLCEKSIMENLELLKEVEFKNEMYIEFLNSREEMKRYTGLPHVGRAMYHQNTMFSLMTKHSPIKHELMHMIATYKWGDSADFWIDEGLATYSGGTCSDYTLEEIYNYYIQSGKLIPINALTSDDFYNYNDMITYTQSAFIVKYLLDNYGYEKFKVLWKDGFVNFNKIYGFQFDDVQKRIESELKIKYPIDIAFNWEEFNKGCQ